MRADLLALSADDLVALSNRGTVKRAARELAGLELTEEADGTVLAAAADAVAQLPPGVALGDATCSCPAAGLCRHVVGAVLAYHEQHEAPALAAWDPGAITDEALAAVGRGALLRGVRALAARGQVADLVRAARPVARLHDADAIVRFPVPGELAHARCTCGQPAPCEHAGLAVLAFRELDGPAGTVELGAPPPLPPLDELEDGLGLLVEAGVAAGRPAVVRALERDAAHALELGLRWPADTLAELADAVRRHGAAEASYAPREAVALVAELAARLDALRAGSVPRTLLAGTARRGDAEVRGGLLIGLGCRARRVGAVSHFDALLLDPAGGRVLIAGRSVEAAPSFAQLAAGTLRPGIGFAALGRGQLVVTGATLSPAGRLKRLELE